MTRAVSTRSEESLSFLLDCDNKTFSELCRNFKGEGKFLLWDNERDDQRPHRDLN